MFGQNVSQLLPSLVCSFHLKADNADHIYLDPEQVQLAWNNTAVIDFGDWRQTLVTLE